MLLRRGTWACVQFSSLLKYKSLKNYSLVRSWHRKEQKFGIPFVYYLSSNFRIHVCYWLNPAFFEWFSIVISIMVFMSTPICHSLKQVVYLALWGTECHLELKAAGVAPGIEFRSPPLNHLTLPRLLHLICLPHPWIAITSVLLNRMH